MGKYTDEEIRAMKRLPAKLRQITLELHLWPSV